jgi:hypothetical protein
MLSQKRLFAENLDVEPCYSGAGKEQKRYGFIEKERTCQIKVQEHKDRIPRVGKNPCGDKLPCSLRVDPDTPRVSKRNQGGGENENSAHNHRRARHLKAAAKT